MGRAAQASARGFDLFARPGFLVFIGAMTSAALVAPDFRRLSVRDAAVLLAIATTAPLLVHMLPSWDAAPVGAHLLPMFWATFVAAYFYGGTVGALTGLVSPPINMLFTALPAWSMVAVLGGELAVFALVSAWLVRRAPGSWYPAPLAAVAAILSCAALQAILPIFGNVFTGRLPVASLAAGLPGIALLGAINFFLVKSHPKR